MNLLDLFVKVGVDDQASGQIEGISNGIRGKLAGAVGSIAKVAAAGTAAAGAAAVAVGKQAFDAYSSFEQLQGGVAKLYGNAGQSVEQYAESVGKSVAGVTKEYERNARAQELVMQNAQQAWRTAGMDANSYMETATSFSAALVNSLQGDTEKAAQQTDVAMRAISDNVNTFGSDMQSVEYAFQGFAKQNYTMLDNLKLGYGGTKEEMQRLIDDANEWGRANGEASDLSIESFSDVVTAIEQIQKKQGIYGTTQKEALSTIEGSANAFKSAWQNLVTELGKPDADIGARVSDMITAVMGENGEGGLLKNVTKAAKTIAVNIIDNVRKGVADGLGWLVSNAPKLVKDAMGRVADTVSAAASGLAGVDLSGVLGGDGDLGARLAGAITEAAPRLMDAAMQLLSALGTFLTTNGPVIMQAVQGMLTSAWQAVSDFAPVALQAVGDLLRQAFNAVIEHGPELMANLAELGMQALAWLSEHGLELIGHLGEVIANVVNFLVEHREEILAAIGEALQGVVNAIVTYGPIILQNVAQAIGELAGYLVGAAGELLAGLLQSLKDHWPEIKDWFMNLPQTILDALGDLGGVLIDAGKNLIGGFFKGLTERFEGVKEWVGGIGQWIADHKGPKAYDLRLLEPNAKWIMESLNSGFIKSIPMLEDTLSRVSDTIQSGVDAEVSTSLAVSPAQQSDPRVLQLLTAILDKDQNVYLDSGRLVGGIAPQMDYAMGRL